MNRAWLARAIAVMRSTKPAVTDDGEFYRRSELSGTDPDRFQREFAEWLERHPDWGEVTRGEQITAWLRATD
jgi:hypothetical protein